MDSINVLDLFSGMGGFSRGFSEVGARVTGVDVNDRSKEAYLAMTGGHFIHADLHNEVIEDGGYDVIIGGPPCRPWSSLNTTKRGPNHPDYPLVSKYLKHVVLNKPEVFVMENVPPLKNDPTYTELIETARKLKYSVDSIKVTYSEYGANIKRSRLLVLGAKNFNVNDFFFNLSSLKRPSKTVKDAIYDLRSLELGKVRDHVWPDLTTIEKYRKYYENGKYGWRILKWNETAPSFGNVMKTYTLHPDSDFNGHGARTISVAEASRIMGYPRDFTFPTGIPMGQRYQMIVDSVSPVFSRVLAESIYKWVSEGYSYDR